MKKFLILLVLICTLTATKADPKHDTTKVLLTNIPIQQPVTFDSASTVRILTGAGADSLSKELRFWIPLSITFIASLLAIALTLRNQRRDKIYKDLAFLAETDKMLVHDPELWAIYDEDLELYKRASKRKLTMTVIKNGTGKLTIQKAGSVTDELVHESLLTSIPGLTIQGDAEITFTVTGQDTSLPDFDEVGMKNKLRAFCYFKLNNFELAMERNHAKNARNTWIKYMIHTIIHSTLFKSVLEKESRDILYTAKFITKMKNLLATAAAVTVVLDGYDKAGEEAEKSMATATTEAGETAISATAASKLKDAKIITNFKKRHDHSRDSNEYLAAIKAYSELVAPIIESKWMEQKNKKA